MRVATGEVEETCVDQAKSVGGLKGGRARAESLTPEQRSDIARKGAAARWQPTEACQRLRRRAPGAE